MSKDVFFLDHRNGEDSLQTGSKANTWEVRRCSLMISRNKLTYFQSTGGDGLRSCPPSIEARVQVG